MQEITVRINKRTASIPPGTYIVADNDEWKVKFIFDDEWKQFQLKCSRIIVNEEMIDIFFEDDSIILPPFPQDCGSISIGVFAYTGTDLPPIYSSTVAKIPILNSALNDAEGTYIPVQPDVVQQANPLTPTDIIHVQNIVAGAVLYATIQQIIDLVQSSGITPEQLAEALSAYRTANAQNAIDSALSDAIANKYTKPSGGIPKSDMTAEVQSSLDKADSALQSAPVISVNGLTGAVTIIVPSTAEDVGAIAAPVSPSTGDALVYDGDAWVAQKNAPKYTVLTLAVGDWQSSGNGYACSKTVTGMTATSIVWLSYSDTETAFTETQAADTLTFTVAELPDAAITVNVAFTEGSALA